MTEERSKKKTLKVLLIEENPISRDARKASIEAMEHDFYEYTVVATANEIEARQQIENHAEPFNFLLVDLLLKSGHQTDFGSVINAEDIEDNENGAKVVQRLLHLHREIHEEQASNPWQLRPVVYSAAQPLPEQANELTIKILCYGAYDFISREPEEMKNVFQSLTDMCELQDELSKTLDSDNWGSRVLNSTGFGISVIGKHWKIWYCSDTNRRLSGIAKNRFLDKVCWMEYNGFEKRATPCPECPSNIVMNSDKCQGLNHSNRVCSKELYPFDPLRERGCSKQKTIDICPVSQAKVPSYTNTRLLTVKNRQPKWVRITATQIRSRSDQRIIGASEAIVDVHELENAYWDAKQLAGELSVEERLRPVLHLIQWMGYRRSRVFRLSNDGMQIVGLIELGNEMLVGFPGFRFPASNTLLKDFREGKKGVASIRNGPGFKAKELGKEQCKHFLEFILQDPKKTERVLGTLVIDDVRAANILCTRKYTEKELKSLRYIAEYIAHILSIQYMYENQNAHRRHDNSLRILENWADSTIKSTQSILAYEYNTQLYYNLSIQLKAILELEPGLAGFHLRFMNTDGMLKLYPGTGQYPQIQRENLLSLDNKYSLSAKCFREGKEHIEKNAQSYSGIIFYKNLLKAVASKEEKIEASNWLNSIETIGAFPIVCDTYKYGTLLVQSYASDFFDSDSGAFLREICNMIGRVLGLIRQERDRHEFFENAAYAFRGPASVLHELARIRWMYARNEDVEDAEGELALAEYLHAKANSFHFETGGTGGFTPALGTVNLAEIWNSWCAMFRGMAQYGRKSIQLDIVPFDEPSFRMANMTTDRVLLTEIIFNIFENALNACRTTVRISATFDVEKLTVQIDDDGPGISDSALKHLYKRYHEDYESGTNRGFGLGLKWSKRHADLLGVILKPRQQGELGGASMAISISISNNI